MTPSSSSGGYEEGFDAIQRMVDLEPSLASYARVSYGRELQGDIAAPAEALVAATRVAPGRPEQAFASFQLGELHWNAGRAPSTSPAGGTDPAALVTPLRTPRNEPVLTVVSRVGGGGYAMNGALPSLAKGDVYQLWAVGNGGGERAVATLGERVDAVVISLPSDVTGFILTVEKAPTPSRPTLPAVAGARISS